MRNISKAVSDDSYRQARIGTAKNDASVSAARVPLLSPGSRKNDDPTPHPSSRADAEIKNSTSFLGYDPVKIVRTIGESAVYSRCLHSFTVQKTPKTTVEPGQTGGWRKSDHPKMTEDYEWA
jgi:hypothetical protein